MLYESELFSNSLKHQHVFLRAGQHINVFKLFLTFFFLRVGPALLVGSYFVCFIISSVRRGGDMVAIPPSATARNTFDTFDSMKQTKY